LKDHVPVDRIVSFSQEKLHSWSAAIEFFRVTREVRGISPDWILNLSWDRTSILWSWFSGAPVRVGIEEYGRPRLLSLLYSKVVTAPERSRDARHMADFYFEPLRTLGFLEGLQYPKLQPGIEAQERVRMLLETVFGRIPGFILIHPGGRLKQKRWPVEKFSELIRSLLPRTEMKVVVVCGPGEEMWASELERVLPQKRGWFWASPQLSEYIALAGMASVFVGNDSGPMHVAAAVGCPCVAIFGNDPTRWKPMGEEHGVIGGTAGFHQVEVETVLKAIIAKLPIVLSKSQDVRILK
jgi:heptosyltransferase-3